jgi:hypothetical protein
MAAFTCAVISWLAPVITMSTVEHWAEVLLQMEKRQKLPAGVIPLTLSSTVRLKLPAELPIYTEDYQ